MRRPRTPTDRPRADLLAFERALEVTAETDSPVDRESLVLVEVAWMIADTVVSSFGWVVALRDGRRLYVEYTLSDIESEVEGKPSEEISIAPLAPGQEYPVLDNSAGVFWYRPDHINDHLGLSGPRLH
jgi:hypothetical protein